MDLVVGRLVIYGCCYFCTMATQLDEHLICAGADLVERIYACMQIAEV